MNITPLSPPNLHPPLSPPPTQSSFLTNPIVPKRQAQLQKLRSINKMLDICEKNGVKHQDLKNMFSKEEMNMVEYLKFLKKQYPKQFKKEILDQKDENDEYEDLNKIFEANSEEDDEDKKKKKV